MPASKPRIGVIGVGFGAQVYIPGLQSEGWEVAAVCSRNREKATKVAEAAGIRNVHTDPLELIRGTISPPLRLQRRPARTVSSPSRR